MKVCVFEREPAACDQIDPAEPELKEEVERLRKALSTLRSRKLERTPISNREVGALGLLLRHQLSDVWMSRRPGAVREMRVGEFDQEYFHKYYRRACGEFQEYSSFKSRCLHLASVATGQSVDSFRKSFVYLSADSDGTTVRFPAPDRVEAMIQELHRHLIGMMAQDPYRPVHALVGISGIHPFLDANGRCARFWASVLANIGGEVPVSIPFRAVAEASCGGFELRVREAEISNRWLPVTQMFTLVIEALER